MFEWRLVISFVLARARFFNDDVCEKSGSYKFSSLFFKLNDRFLFFFNRFIYDLAVEVGDVCFRCDL